MELGNILEILDVVSVSFLRVYEGKMVLKFKKKIIKLKIIND